MSNTTQFIGKTLPALLIILILGACSSTKTVVKQYYLLETTTSYDSLLEARFPQVNLEVAEVQVAPAFATEAIALRDNSHQLRYFEDHRWAVRPDANLRHLLINHLSAAGLFQRVAERYWQQRAHYRLETRVQRLDVEKRNKELYAVLQLDFSLIETAGGRTLVKQQVQSEKKLGDRRLNTMAAAMSEVLTQELDRLANQIAEAVEENEKGPKP